MCNGNVTKSGKTETKLRARINNHISDYKSGNTTDMFDLHVHQCGIENNCHILEFMKLSKPNKLLTYEKIIHKRKYATINT